MSLRTACRPSRGFTLLEILVVLIIIGILAGAFLGLGGGLLDQRRRQTRIRIQQLATVIETFRTVEGDYPPDRLPAAAGGDAVNARAEALFTALFDPQWTGTRPDQDWLVNTDGDQSRKPVSLLPSRELFEIGDAWGNPILYFESLHYEEPAAVLAGPEGEVWQQTGAARRNARTGGWERPGGFQLISAGEDGAFGTGDDVANFELE